MEKSGGRWIVDEVVAEMPFGEQVGVGPRGAVCVGEHADGGGVDDEVMIGDEVGSSRVRDGIGMLLGGARYLSAFYAQLPQGVVHGFGCAACAENKGFGVVGLQEGSEGFEEGRGVGIVADELSVAYLYAVDCPNSLCGTIQLVEDRDDRLFVGYGDIEAADKVL